MLINKRKLLEKNYQQTTLLCDFVVHIEQTMCGTAQRTSQNDDPFEEPASAVELTAADSKKRDQCDKEEEERRSETEKSRR